VLLDVSTAITLRRELLEAIQQKFSNLQAFDDLQWPLVTTNGSPLPRPKPRMRARMALMDSDDEDDDSNIDTASLKQYWDSIRDKYNSRSFSQVNLSTPQADCLPKNWTVININITEDKNTMFITRQRAQHEPLIFCVPLKGRRETEEDEHLTFDDALNELKQIITLSNQGTRQAVHVKNDDPQARASWWAERSALDKRMQELLENIEFCWLGAFKVRSYQGSLCLGTIDV
jgi:separase